MIYYPKRRTARKRVRRDIRQCWLPFPIQSRISFARKSNNTADDISLIENCNRCPSCGAGNFVYACHYQCKTCGFIVSCDD